MSKNGSNSYSRPDCVENHSGRCVSNPLILAVETSGRTGSVAIALGPRILAETLFSGPMRHSAEIFPAIEGLLNKFGRKPKEIEHIYISVGPGSFTGLRIAVTVAKTMHLANAVKIATVDTLDVIAANATDYQKTQPPQLNISKIATILDAKRGQFFVAVYKHLRGGKNAMTETQDQIPDTKHGTWKKIFPDSLMTAEQFLGKVVGKDGPVWLLGEGLVYHKDKFQADTVRFLPENCWRPTAVKVHLLGWNMALQGRFAEALALQPTYLRRPAPEEKSEIKKQNAK